MRVKEKSTAQGQFWLPSDSNNCVSGQLVIADGGDVFVTLQSLFDKSAEAINKAFRGEIDFDRVSGHVEGLGPVTLEKCTHNGSFFSSSICTLRLQCGLLIIGHACQSTSDVFFNNIRFSMDGIDEWVNISGFNIDWQHAENKISVDYTLPDPIDIYSSDIASIRIVFGYSPPGISSKHRVEISQYTHFELRLIKPLTFDAIASYIYKMLTFMCLAIGQPVSLTKASAKVVEAVSSNDYNASCERVELIYSSLPYSEKVPSVFAPEFLFGYGDIKDDVKLYFECWIDKYELISAALSLYFGVKYDSHKFLDAKFLALGTAPE